MERIDHGVYGPCGVPLTWRRRLMVGLLLAPPGSLGSHRSAATMLGVGGNRQTVRELRARHRLGFEDLLRTYLRHKRSGRNGGAALRDWLDRYVDVGGLPESGLEQLALDALLDAGLHPVAQLWVQVPNGCRYRLDLAFPDLMIAVEVDGSQHEERPAKAADAVRDAALEALGWTVIHVRSKTFAADLARAIRKIVAASAQA